MKGRNRNTAWLSITKEEWPEIEEIYIQWLEQALKGDHKSLSSMTDKLSSKLIFYFVRLFQENISFAKKFKCSERIG
jgi:hypothetical protein